MGEKFWKQKSLRGKFRKCDIGGSFQMAAVLALSELGMKQPSEYKDSQAGIDQAQMEILMSRSTTIYVGNLNFKTTESTLYSVFSQFGPVKRVIMGVNKYTKVPCGFCFVVFFTREAALASINNSIVIKIDGNLIRRDLDRGYENGRELGRGKSGGQVRDEQKFHGQYRQNPKNRRNNGRR